MGSNDAKMARHLDRIIRQMSALLAGTYLDAVIPALTLLRTQSGKVDRGAITELLVASEMLQDNAESGQGSSDSPRHSQKCRLDVWGNVLGVDRMHPRERVIEPAITEFLGIGGTSSQLA